jgi:hypothetical protein
MSVSSVLNTLPDAYPKAGISTARMRKTLLVYTLLCMLGALPAFLGAKPWLQALGWGLWFPGGGFASLGGWWWFAVLLSASLFFVALFLWFASGNVVAPVLVWLLSACAATLVTETPNPLGRVVVPSCVLAMGLMLWRGNMRRAREIRTRREQRLTSLPPVIEEVTLRLKKPAVEPEIKREMSRQDLAAMRYLFDRGLQPLESFKGFTRIEQFQPAALRYQLFDLQYSLAMSQCIYTPSFDGYLSQAQRNLIEKVQLPEVWGYWKWESLWGRLTTDFDPVVKDNIMLTGFYLMSLGLYASNTGDRRYETPGILDFRLSNGQRFPHSMNSVADALVRNFNESAFCLYPCEPNWIYTFCNLQGMTGLVLYDRIKGTTHGTQLRERFGSMWRSEFTSPDGTVMPIRSSLTGLAIPGLVGLSSDTSGSVLAGPLMPAVALRMWAQARSESIRVRSDGLLDLKTVGADNMDPGNYQKGLGMSYAMVMFAANEYGDYEVADAAQRSLDQYCEPILENGTFSYRKLSVMMNSTAVRARLARQGDWRRTVLLGPSPETCRGPRLVEASYPQVLVARAVSDGSDLELVLYPGDAPGVQRLGIDRLVPNKTYSVNGAGFRDDGVRLADPEGKLWINAVLADRTQLSVRPIEG